MPTNLASGIWGGEKTVPRNEEQALTKIVSATKATNASNAEVQRRRDGRFPFDPILFSEKNSIAALAIGRTFADHPLAWMRDATGEFVPTENAFFSPEGILIFLSIGHVSGIDVSYD